MSRTGTALDIDTVRIFIAVIEGGDYAAAARKTGLTRSAVGKAVLRLETRLGTRLLHRNTRRISPTGDGLALQERFGIILSDIDEAEAAIRTGAASIHGTLRLSLPDAYGRLRVLPVLEEYLAAFPDASVEAGLTDRVVDIVGEGVDVAVRIGPPPPVDGLISRVVDRVEGVRCASPAYLRQRGLPTGFDALRGHDLLAFVDERRLPWEADARNGVLAGARVRATYDSAEAIRASTLAGLGIAHLPRFLVGEDLAAGRLHEVLPHLDRATADVRVLYPARRHLPARARLFIDLLAERLG